MSRCMRVIIYSGIYKDTLKKEHNKSSNDHFFVVQTWLVSLLGLASLEVLLAIIFHYPTKAVLLLFVM